MMLPLLAACTAPEAPSQGGAGTVLAHEGAVARMLDDTLLQIETQTRGGDAGDAASYAECAAARFAHENGFGYLRHVRTLTDETAGIWRADAVYTISAAMPEGLRTIVADEMVLRCARQGIPTV